MTEQHRSAATGQYATAEQAAANPREHVTHKAPTWRMLRKLRRERDDLAAALRCREEQATRSGAERHALAVKLAAVYALAEGAIYHGNPDDAGVYPLIRSQFAAEVLAVLDDDGDTPTT